MINSNMRCIEIQTALWVDIHAIQINSNMRCIEMNKCATLRYIQETDKQ